MDRNSVDWRGYIPALTTPFTADGHFDEEATRQLHRSMFEKGLHGIIVMGTQGEWFSLSPEEKQRLLDITGEQLSGKLTLIAGCNAFRAQDALHNIECAARAGFNGALLTPPPYIMPQDNEILAFYEEVSVRSPLPICVYNWPPGTNIDMSLSLLREVAELDHVVAIKNSTPDFGHFLEVFFALNDKVRVFGIPMNELGITLVQHHGADGTMGAGAVLGSDHPDFFNAIWAGDIERARELGQRDEKLMRAWFKRDYMGRFGSPQAIFKEALNQQGLPGGYPRRPILPLDKEGIAVIRQTLIELGKIHP